jgi:superfamily II DNA/RNA helicase
MPIQLSGTRARLGAGVRRQPGDLAADLEEMGPGANFLHGGMSQNERAVGLHAFMSHDGILVATSGIISTGLDLSKVGDLVFYDTPAHRGLVQNIVGRVNRFGRTGVLSVHVLHCDGDPDSEYAAGLSAMLSVSLEMR